MGTRKTGRENIAPMATHPRRPPEATMTQRYPEFDILLPSKSS
jgi:hypothetical protein